MAATDATGMDDGCCGKDGPVMTMMNKRLRALKKKYNRIVQLEESKQQGKAINKEQEDVLKSKAQVLSLIEEYERLRQPLMAAVKEEVAEKEKEWLAAKEEQVGSEDKEGLTSNESTEEARTESEDVGNENLHADADVNGGDAPEDGGEKTQGSSVESSVEENRPADLDEHVLDLIQVLYFAQLFDVNSHGHGDAHSYVWTKFHERTSCLSYDLVTDDSTSPLSEADLDALASFGTLITTRPPNATLSHKDALQNCVSHARHWLLSSELPINCGLNITYAELKERLNRIIATEYLTMTPELQTVTQQIAEAATAAGQYGKSDFMEIMMPREQYDNGDSVANSADNILDSSPTNIEVSQLEGTNQAGPNEIQVSEEEQQSPEQQIVDQNGSMFPQAPQKHPAQQQPQQQNKNGQQQPQQPQQPQQQKYRGGGRGAGGGGYGRGRGYSGGRSGGRGNRGGGYANGRSGQGGYYDQGGYYQRGYYGNGGGGGGRRGGRGYYNNNNNNSNSSSHLNVNANANAASGAATVPSQSG